MLTLVAILSASKARRSRNAIKKSFNQMNKFFFTFYINPLSFYNDLWSEYNLVNFLFPKFSKTILSSPGWALSDSTMETAETKNVPTFWTRFKYCGFITYNNHEIFGVMVSTFASHLIDPSLNPSKVTIYLSIFTEIFEKVHF